VNSANVYAGASAVLYKIWQKFDYSKNNFLDIAEFEQCSAMLGLHWDVKLAWSESLELTHKNTASNTCYHCGEVGHWKAACPKINGNDWQGAMDGFEKQNPEKVTFERLMSSGPCQQLPAPDEIDFGSFVKVRAPLSDQLPLTPRRNALCTTRSSPALAAHSLVSSRCAVISTAVTE
jgi:hypothetical protein